MKITDILKPSHVLFDEAIGSKKQLLEVIAKTASPIIKCEPQIIFDALVERERLGTTGIGKGVAIPHARLAGLTDLYNLFPQHIRQFQFHVHTEVLWLWEHLY